MDTRDVAAVDRTASGARPLRGWTTGAALWPYLCVTLGGLLDLSTLFLSIGFYGGLSLLPLAVIASRRVKTDYATPRRWNALIDLGVTLAGLAFFLWLYLPYSGAYWNPFEFRF